MVLDPFGLWLCYAGLKGSPNRSIEIDHPARLFFYLFHEVAFDNHKTQNDPGNLSKVPRQRDGSDGPRHENCQP